jgi:hypothetical protein
MRRLGILVCLLVLSWCGPACGEGWYYAGASCSSASNEVGIRATGTHKAVFHDYIMIFPVTADCTGALNYAKIYQVNADKTSSAKVAVFPRTGAPVVGNAIIGAWTSAIAFQASAATWIPAGTTATISGNVASGDYWIALLVDGDSTSVGQSGSSGAYYRACASCYDSPPTTLTGTWSADDYETLSIYVTIGN